MTLLNTIEIAAQNFRASVQLAAVNRVGLMSTKGICKCYAKVASKRGMPTHIVMTLVKEVIQWLLRHTAHRLWTCR
jgi:hypothetical protein